MDACYCSTLQQKRITGHGS
jgi:hypothetical protein